VLGRAGIRARAFAKLFPDDPAAAADGPASDAGSQAHVSTDVVEGGAVVAGTIEDLPAQIGRFRVVGRIGKGGMGVVVRAHDPELDRHVAIKLLRPELRGSGSAGSIGPARLLREAQAMARINDPNVITVHEVGTVGDQVFIAMELVEGQTLADWVRATKRPWRAVLDVFLRAGDGIAAAHAAGVVHRDFKPDNVLIGLDAAGARVDRVRVVDFGLARATGIAMDVTVSEPERATEHADALRSPLTRTGAVMGTPAYMSPEQYLGRAADERSDQFSFCVALWEALFGKRPFAGATLPDLAAAVVGGQMREPPSDVVPRFVVAALRRGLASAPGDRFATMADLLASLRRDPARRWRRIGAVAGVAATASVVGFAIARTDDGRCDDVGQRLVGVWDDDARASVRTAILATSAPFAERSRQSLEGLLDSYAAAWRELATQACAGARVRDEEGRELAARRQRCLDARLAELDGLVDLLATADAAMAINAVDAATRLPDLGACSDSQRLAAWHDADDPSARERLQQARSTLARAGAEGAIGHYKDAITVAQEVVDVATELEDPALEAAALLVRGQNEERSGASAQAEATLRLAVEQAERAEDHGTRAQALIHLVYIVGYAKDEQRHAEALAFAADAGAVLRVIGADPLLRAQLDNNLAVTAKRAGDLDDARAHSEQALAIYEELFGEQHPSTLRALVNLGNVMRLQKRLPEAEAVLRRADEASQLVLGGNHPLVASTASNLAITLANQNRPYEAVPEFRRSLEIRTLNDPDHPDIGKAHHNLATALYETRAYAEAIEHYQQGLASGVRHGASEDVLVAYHEGLGQAAVRAGRFELARDSLAHVITVHERKTDPGKLASARAELAILLVGRDPARALELVAEIREWLATRGKDGPTRKGDRVLADQIAVVAALAESQLLLRTIPSPPK
jgi:tetratricopeptide (TPR) repeat protein